MGVCTPTSHARRLIKLYLPSRHADSRYWQNDTFFVLTDKPWAVPLPDFIAIRSSPQREGHVTNNKAVKVLAVRGPPITSHVKEDKQLGSSISLPDAMALAESAEDLPSPMLFNHDDNCEQSQQGGSG